MHAIDYIKLTTTGLLFSKACDRLYCVLLVRVHHVAAVCIAIYWIIVNVCCQCVYSDVYAVYEQQTLDE
jgi:hypothetical protein